MGPIDGIFKGLIGELVWQVQRGVGTFLTLEFGVPHLAIYEPITASPGSLPRVRRNLKRRGVYVTGDWHLWVQYGEWKVSTADGVLRSCDPIGSVLDECLRDLNGQRLLSIDCVELAHSSRFTFDLGGILEIWPSIEIPDDQWSLYIWNGEVVACRNDGNLVIGKRDRAK